MYIYIIYIIYAYTYIYSVNYSKSSCRTIVNYGITYGIETMESVILYSVLRNGNAFSITCFVWKTDVQSGFACEATRRFGDFIQEKKVKNFTVTLKKMYKMCRFYSPPYEQNPDHRQEKGSLHSTDLYRLAFILTLSYKLIM